MGKIIAITGAGEGLGKALAKRLAADGDTVILLGRTLSKLEAVLGEIGDEHMAVACEVGNPDSVRAAFAAVAERFPKIDVLINNAAIYQPFDLGEAADETIMAMTMTNFVGPIFVAREALPLLRGGGHLINVSSESVHLRLAMLWLYEGTKAGLEMMSYMWGRELAAEGVKVSVVQAGAMMDPTNLKAPDWPGDTGMRFHMANARQGNDMRQMPISTYKSVTDVFRAVIDMPADVHLNFVGVGGNPLPRQSNS